MKTYIVELYYLVEYCKYSDLKDEIIRDRLVGASSTRRCLSSYEWTGPCTYLEKAEKTIRQKEDVREQSHTLKQDYKNSKC